jgi:Flp pilus assembly pilin Flp
LKIHEDVAMNWQSIARRAQRLRRRDDGQDLVEYGMLAALIAIAALTAVNGLASVIKTQFWDVAANFL